MSKGPGVTSPSPLLQNLQELSENIQAAWDVLLQDTVKNLNAEISGMCMCMPDKKIPISV